MEIALILASIALYLASLLSGIFRKEKAARVLVCAGLAIHFALLVFRAVRAQHPPFTNIYETLLLLSWLMMLKCTFLQKGTSPLVLHLQRGFILLVLSIPLFLPPEMRAVTPVMPALKSVWMYIHVPSYLIGYVALFSAFILAVIRLFYKPGAFPHEGQFELDVRLSMLFLSIGLVTGAVWGQLSWAAYWSWDPKETWALINILILALYFRTESRTARSVIVIITFLSILFTYFGVSWLMSGLHSY